MTILVAMASTEVGTDNNRTPTPTGGDLDRTTQDLIHLDLNNHNGSVFLCFKMRSDRAKASANANVTIFFGVCCLFFDLFCFVFDPFPPPLPLSLGVNRPLYVKGNYSLEELQAMKNQIEH